MIDLLWLIVIAYILGSIPSGVVISKICGAQDPRRVGSQNIGATNVMRSGGRLLGVITLIFDILKGLLPVLLSNGHSKFYEALMMVFSVLGHIFPFTLRFKGGKGVATMLGALIGVNPLFAGAALSVWLIVFFMFRYASVASICASVFVGIGGFAFIHTSVACAALVLSMIIIYRHKSNIILLAREKKRWKL